MSATSGPTPDGSAQRPTVTRELRLLCEAFTDGVFVVGPDGCVLSANGAMERLLGYRPGGLDGRTVRGLFRVSEVIGWRRVCQALRRQGAICPETRETVAIHRGGRRVPVSLTTAPVRIAAGRALLCTVHDRSDREAVERRLATRRHHQEVLAEIAHRALDTSSVTELATAVVEMVAGAIEADAVVCVEGREDAARVVASAGDLPLAPGDIVRPPAESRRGIEPGRRIESGRGSGAGRRIGIGRPIGDAESEPFGDFESVHVERLSTFGRRTGYLVVLRRRTGGLTRAETEFLDTVTQVMAGALRRARAERALRSGEERLRAVFRAAGMGIALLDRSGRVRDANATLHELVGARAGTLMGGDAIAAVHAGDRRPLARALVDLVRNRRRAANVEIRLVGAAGQVIWSSATFSVIRGRGGQIDFVLAMIEDISGKKALEEQLAQSRKLDAMGRLAAGVAHDFNNLLMLVRANCAWMRDVTTDVAVTECVDRIEAATGRGADLTRQLLTFGREQPLQTQVVDLGEIVRRLSRMLGRTLGEHIALVVDAPAAPGVRADPAEVERVVLNLVLNARDAMAEGGMLSVRVARLDEVVELTVTDQGCGMDQATVERIFEPFYSTKSAGKGSGLGLATAYGIIRQCGGDILVDSELGVGSRFRVRLPLVDTGVSGALPEPD